MIFTVLQILVSFCVCTCYILFCIISSTVAPIISVKDNGEDCFLPCILLYFFMISRSDLVFCLRSIWLRLESGETHNGNHQMKQYTFAYCECANNYIALWNVTTTVCTNLIEFQEDNYEKLCNIQVDLLSLRDDDTFAVIDAVFEERSAIRLKNVIWVYTRKAYATISTRTLKLT